MNARQFRSRVASILNLDFDQLLDGGVIDYGAPDRLEQWQALNADPIRWFLRLDDARLEALWTLIEERNRGR